MARTIDKPYDRIWEDVKAGNLVPFDESYPSDIFSIPRILAWQLLVIPEAILSLRFQPGRRTPIPPPEADGTFTPDSDS